MAKPSKKKQRLESTSLTQNSGQSSGKSEKKSHKRKEKASIQPLGSEATLAKLLDEESKDDEERRLESMLFGVPYVPSGKVSSSRRVAEGGLVFDIDEDDGNGQNDEEYQGGGRPMASLLDSDLFFVDDGLGQPVPDYPLISETSSKSDSGSPSDAESSSEHDSDELGTDSDSQPSSSSPPTPRPRSPKSRTRTRAAAWTDTSTSPHQISLLSGPSRLRKLRNFVDEDEVTEKDYESRLRAQFERINPEPSWAQRARKRNREEREAQGIVDEEEAAERRRKGTAVLPSGTLSIERLRDANLSTAKSGSGEVKVVAFHPSDRVPILCVGTTDRRVRLYNVDGHTSPLLQTLHTPSLPLTSSTSALFHPSGSSILLSGPRPYFFTHDLQTGTTTKHERGLWGTTFSSTHSSIDVGMKRSRGSRNDDAKSIHMTSFSPSGDLLAVVASKGAQVHFVDWKSGAGQVIGSIKCSLGGGSVAGVWWYDGSSSSDVLGDVGVGGPKTHLAVLTSDAEVYLWDVGERRCVRRWKDEGGFRGAGRALAGTQTGNAYMAVGSSSGLVNIYNSNAYSPSPSEATKAPQPIKSIGNLTTAISSLKFNHDAQLLAVASREKKDSMRLIHVPTLTSFANWPTQSTPLGVVTTVDFSPKSEYVAIGNKRGRVLLYHLREYGAGVA
ncbi:putative U3 small nucleolar RNA-associated protein 18 [Leucoagaricus sp. SymC.cos]|nr:putative U3 small nucleolar RNA-associated protein 18 [Leucoagaricus sp. SymC.cos]